MESVLLIFLGVGVYYLAVGRRRLSGKAGRRLKPPRERPRPWHVPKPARPPSIRVSRFDETSARHLPGERVVSGPAWITDGDTIKIRNTQIRLFGIDAPELNHPYGKKAKWALHNLCKGQIVRAELSDIDQYGRTVGRCYLPDGRDLSAEMVRLGLALDWPKFSGGKYQDLETSDARTRLFLADARQKGRMHLWQQFETRQAKR